MFGGGWKRRPCDMKMLIPGLAQGQPFPPVEMEVEVAGTILWESQTIAVPESR
jgi:hypothetical protein